MDEQRAGQRRKAGREQERRELVADTSMPSAVAASSLPATADSARPKREWRMREAARAQAATTSASRINCPRSEVTS